MLDLICNFSSEFLWVRPIELGKHEFEWANEVDWNNEILNFSRIIFWESVVLSLDMILNLKDTFCWCSVDLAGSWKQWDQTFNNFMVGRGR